MLLCLKQFGVSDIFYVFVFYILYFYILNFDFCIFCIFVFLLALAIDGGWGGGDLLRNAMISSARLQRRPLNCAAGVGKIWEASKRPELEREKCALNCAALQIRVRKIWEAQKRAQLELGRRRKTALPNWTKFELEKSVQWKKRLLQTEKVTQLCTCEEQSWKRSWKKLTLGNKRGGWKKVHASREGHSIVELCRAELEKVRKKRGARWNSWTVWTKLGGYKKIELERRKLSRPLNCRAVHSSQITVEKRQEGGYVNKMCTPCDSIASCSQNVVARMHPGQSVPVTDKGERAKRNMFENTKPSVYSVAT